jgi:hypothetical protein
VKVEAYMARSGLTQCYNCQKFGHVWVNCRQPPRCLWCGGGHLHKECPKSQKENSTPNCCNCKLKEGERPHPSSYRGYSNTKEESLLRRSQRSTPRKHWEGRFLRNGLYPGNLSQRYYVAICSKYNRLSSCRPSRRR